MNALIIANTQIRRDAANRYCLNDLHQASGGEKRNQPSNWLRSEKTIELVERLKSEEPLLKNEERSPAQPIISIEGGLGQGTYAVKELVYAYATWISAEFFLHVIRAYDALVTGEVSETRAAIVGPQAKADQMVGGDRIFRAAYRVARTMGMSRSHAVEAANKTARRHADVDFVEEFGADIVHAEIGTRKIPDWDGLETFMAWLRQRDEVRIDLAAAEVFPDHPDPRHLKIRMGNTLGALGWRPRRHRAGELFTTTWKRVRN